MNRRRFGAALGGMLLCASGSIRAQRPKPRIAIPTSGNEQSSSHLIEALKQAMRERGYRDDSVEYEVRYARGQTLMQDQIVAELIAANPDVIVVAGPPLVRAALRLTRTIPIVMANVSDPVGNKFIESLARPGGNVTGIATLYETVLPKVVELLNELIPSASRVAVLLNDNNPSTAAFWHSVDNASRTMRKSAIRMNASSEPEIVDAFSRMKALGAHAAIVVVDTTFVALRARISALAHDAAIPTVYGVREHVVAGGLASYGPSLSGNYRAAARYIDQILKGAKPAAMPVEQPTKFELVLNRKEANFLKIKLSPGTLLRADEVIE